METGGSLRAERDADGHRGLGHSRLQRHGADAARHGQSLADAADPRLVRRLCRPPAGLRSAGRERSKRNSEARSAIVGRIVDSYTNILTLKLFARLEREDAYVREAIDDHTGTFRHQLRR